MTRVIGRANFGVLMFICLAFFWQMQALAVVSMSFSDADEFESTAVSSMDHEIRSIQPVTYQNVVQRKLRRDVWDGSSLADDRWWAQVDYIQWWMKGNTVPSLVTTSPNGTLRDDAGVLPNAQTLFGGDSIDIGARHGGRVSFGRWFDDRHMGGVEFHFFGLSGDNSHYRAEGIGGSPILARPFLNVDSGQQDSAIISHPDVSDGWVQVESKSEAYSAGALWRRNWRYGPRCYIDFVAGYRFFKYRESLNVQDHISTTAPGLFENGTTLDSRDSFSTESDFHGMDVGLVTAYVEGPVELSAVTKLGFGGVRQVVKINGETTIDTPSANPVTSQGGLLALPTNIGTQSNTDFALLPELNINLKYQLTECLSFSIGYTLLYLTKAMRPGDQIDTSVNPTQLPGGGGLSGDPRPESRFHATPVWLQGLNYGGLIEF